jgi:hypothetical protein
MSGSPAQFACPYCGKQKVWKPELAGKQGKCACGQIIMVPRTRPGEGGADREPLVLREPGDDEELKLAPEPPRPVRRPPVVAAPPVATEHEDAGGGSATAVAAAPSRATAKVQIDPTKLMGRHKPLTREARADDSFKFSMIRDGVLPGVLIVAGLCLCVAAGSYQGDQRWLGIEHVLGPVTLNIAAGLALVIAAVYAASAMGGVCFQEPIALVIYKLCAIALVPGAVGQLSGAFIGGFNGDMAAVFVSLAGYAALFCLLFKMAAADRVACVALIFIIRAGVTYLIFRLEGAKEGSDI